MSFENKGFPNDLDSRFSEMNKQFTRYNEPQTIINSAGQLIRLSSGTSSQPIGPVLPRIHSAGFKHKRSVQRFGEVTVPSGVTSYQQPAQLTGKVKSSKDLKKEQRKEKAKGILSTIGDLISGALNPQSQSQSLPEINQPDFIKTDLEGVTIVSKKKSNSMKYLTIGIIALILVVIAYKLIKKK